MNEPTGEIHFGELTSGPYVFKETTACVIPREHVHHLYNLAVATEDRTDEEHGTLIALAHWLTLNRPRGWAYDFHPIDHVESTRRK